MSQQDNVQISIQGAWASYHHLAAIDFINSLDFLPADSEIVPKQDFQQTIDFARGPGRYAVVAIENSLYGSINPVYQLIEDRRDLSIFAETCADIDHQLIAVDSSVKLSDVKKVYSHFAALAQCRGLLRQLPVEAIEYSDTADAVKYIIDNDLRDSAAIASSQAAEMYGGHIIKSGVQDQKDNYTRFYLMSDSKEHDFSVHSEFTSKASLQIVLRNGPGALLEILEIMNDKGLDLSRIESRPISGSKWQYSFHMDFGWVDEPKGRTALKLVQAASKQFRLMGVYPSLNSR